MSFMLRRGAPLPPAAHPQKISTGLPVLGPYAVRIIEQRGASLGRQPLEAGPLPGFWLGPGRVTFLHFLEQFSGRCTVARTL